MGVNATVVYDVATHSTLVLRTSLNSTKNRYDVIDTVASFAQHCESLRGVASTVTEVSALWGGPPFVTYNVVDARFRVMIIWNEDPAEFDLAYDVDNALTRLQSAVAKSTEGLEHHSEDAIAKVYDAAGYALRGDYPVTLQDSSTDQKKSKHKSSQPTLSISRRSSVLDPRRKKGSASAGSGGRLFGKIGSILKKATGNDGDPSEQSQKVPPSSPPSTSTLHSTSQGEAKSAAPFGSDIALDDAIAELQLPDEMFMWGDFGGSLPENDGDLRWFFALAQGERDTETRPQPPMLRQDSAPSTPLTIPSSGSPLAESSSGPSSILPAAETQPVQRKTSALGVPPASGVGTPVPPTVPSSVGSKAASSSRSKENGETSSSVPPTPPVNTQSRIPTQAPSQIGIPTNASQSIGMAQMQPVNPQDSAPTSNLTSIASTPTIPISTESPATNMNSNSIQGQRMEPGPSALGSSGVIPPPPSLATPSHMSSGSITPQQALAIAANSHQNNQILPPALANLRRESDFDVSNLGNFKDQATQSLTPQGAVTNGDNKVVHVQNDDDRIRAAMNQFARSMQNGNFALALQQVQLTLKHLSVMQPRRDREIVTCSNYFLAQKILIRNSVLESELNSIAGGTQEAVQRHVECALLTMFLAELKHLLPRHRVAAMKIAVEKNSIVGNFGMCARWLRILVEKAPPAQKPDFSKRLQLCIQNGERNSHMPPTNRLCYNSLKIVTVPYGKCEACGAYYHPQLGGVTEGQVCPTCLVGRIESKTQ